MNMYSKLRTKTIKKNILPSIIHEFINFVVPLRLKKIPPEQKCQGNQSAGGGGRYRAVDEGERQRRLLSPDFAYEPPVQQQPQGEEHQALQQGRQERGPQPGGREGVLVGIHAVAAEQLHLHVVARQRHQPVAEAELREDEQAPAQAVEEQLDGLWWGWWRGGGGGRERQIVFKIRQRESEGVRVMRRREGETQRDR